MQMVKESSSPDPISIIQDSSPHRGTRMATPLQPRHTNITPPSKSIILDTHAGLGKSPVRIKVTVEAEPRIDINRQVRRKSRSSATSTQGMELPEKQRSPVRRRGRANNSGQSQIQETLLAGHATSTAVPGSTPVARRLRSRQSRAPASAAVEQAAGLEPGLPRHLSQGTRAESLSSNVVSGSSSRLGRSSSPSPETNDDADDEAVELDGDDFADFGDGPADRSYSNDRLDAPGDFTTIESEDFSMISLDSLSSHRSRHTTPASARPGAEPRTKMDVSYMPSSPPLTGQPLVTPVLQQAPKMPPAPSQPAINCPPVLTPLRENAVRSGKVLQDIVRSPERSSSKSLETPSNQLFEGFSANTKRQLRQSLQLGISMAGGDSPELQQRISKDVSSSSGIHYPDLSSAKPNHRLPTPEDGEFAEDSTANRKDSKWYPQLPSQIHEQSHVPPDHSYDDMSWMPTHANNSKHTSSPLKVDGRLSETAARPLHDSSVGAQISTEKPGAAFADGGMENESNEPDIWQAEADRSFDSAEQPEVADEVSALFDGPDRPRRSKLPGTWRRTSGNHFHYSDSPEPEVTTRRHVSDSTGKSNGVVTPPASDVDSNDPSAEAGEDENEQTRLEQASEDDHEGQEIPSPSSDDSSTGGEDTGMFWHSNLPNIYQKGRRPAAANRDMSAISDLRPIDDTTRLDDSRMAARPSLHEAAFGGDEPETSEGEDLSEEQNDSVISRMSEKDTSDTRQLLAELVEDDRRRSFCKPNNLESGSEESCEDQEEGSTIETTYLDTTRSYVEHLNLDSPTKIKVKFNYSSIIASSGVERALRKNTKPDESILSPKKKYHSVFDEDAPLGGTELPSAANLKVHGEEHSSHEVSRDDAPAPMESFMSRMTSTLWSAVTAKPASSPTKETIIVGSAISAEIDAPSSRKEKEEGHLAQSKSKGGRSQKSAARESTTIQDVPAITDLVVRRRRKYGLLSPSHPFTMQHARTLHRLYASSLQHPSSTILPLSSRLAPSLAALVGQEYYSTALDKVHVWRTSDLHAVQGFMALLVPDPERSRLEAMGGWGDEGAKKAKGWDSKGRHGSWFAFAGEGKEDKKARALRGNIEEEWLVGVLGEIACRMQRGTR